MKLCDKCGAINSDDRFFCVDCNEKLDDKLSETQEEKENARLKAKREEFYNKNDPLYVSLFDKIIGFSCVLGIVLLIVAFVFLCNKRKKSFQYWIRIYLLCLRNN